MYHIFENVTNFVPVGKIDLSFEVGCHNLEEIAISNSFIQLFSVNSHSAMKCAHFKES